MARRPSDGYRVMPETAIGETCPGVAAARRVFWPLTTITPVALTRHCTQMGPVGSPASARQGRDPHLPWVSMVSFTRTMNGLFIRSVTKSFRLRSGGIRQNDSGRCSIVSFVPDPSGSKS